MGERADATVAIDDLLGPNRDAREDVGQRLQDVVDLVLLTADIGRLLDPDVG
ncbi:hypothetical protein D3C83_268670 [compost metagenome]